MNISTDKWMALECHQEGCQSIVLQDEIDKLREALRRLLNYLPDGPYYKYVWDECLSDEQEMVKAVRAEAAALLEGNDLGPGISKERMSTGTHAAARNPGPDS